MTPAEKLDAEVNQLAVMMLIAGGPRALAVFQAPSRIECMAQELHYAIRHTSGEDLAKLLGYLGSDVGLAIVRRISGLWDLAGKAVSGSVSETKWMLEAYSCDRLPRHLGERIGTATGTTSVALTRGAKSVSSLVADLRSNPTEAGPKLLVLVLSSVAAGGGVDGNGGAPDLDIPLMGIGAHRSPFTHSIIIGSVLETALLLLMRLVMCTHKNLPKDHDPLWNGIASRSVDILNAAGKGASFGIAYHLMVDSVVQPGAYHGVPFDMPMEAHQAILAANAVAESTAVKTYPDEAAVTATPEILVAHKKYRAIRLPISDAQTKLLNAADVAILAQYGSWLQALARRTIPPTTLAQVQFLKVVDGRCAPNSAHERAWVALVGAEQLTPRPTGR